MRKVDNFKAERERLNSLVMKYAGVITKRFYNLDERVYHDGALDRKIKELMGLTSSLVLRCDDCIEYHLISVDELGATSAEVEEALGVALIVGGSIVIPHLRRAFAIWDELREKRFEFLLKEIEKILSKKSKNMKKLQGICTLLRSNVYHYDWVGFYFLKDNTLLLGPFNGEPTEHVKIKVGEGICGQAAEKMETFIVEDVSKEDNYLSCSPKVKSEIVLPVFKGEKLVGELDIDSHKMNAFDEKDEEFLSRVCEKVGGML